ncbi:glycosyltransferase family 2 protein [Algoriphagus aquimarinus]|uniref:Glycosyl transferase family 2 n=1 Tax=Algoriphagus aquimarinus TaxID=237018 RepID=A0A1I1CDF1_9BACT|nr:glycosyltransferase [Algoriphagus aquimarinus]SFB60036.1 Glycosyl transferase family 2 [Algoriphagus aquimarinus]
MGHLVSIVIPCYNSQEFIAATLDSVLHQTYLNWECILVDDGSSDSTIDTILAYCSRDPRFQLIKSLHRGVSFARNLALTSCKGEFVQLLDSDDLLGKNKIETQVALFELNKDVDIIYSGARYFVSNLKNITFVGRNNLFPTIEITKFDSNVLDVVKLRNPFVTPSPLYRKSVFESVGLYDTNLHYLEDWDFQIRCALQNLKFQYFTFEPEIGPFIRLRNGSLMDDRKQVLRSKIVLYNKYPDLFKDQILDSRKRSIYQKLLYKLGLK